MSSGGSLNKLLKSLEDYGLILKVCCNSALSSSFYRVTNVTFNPLQATLVSKGLILPALSLYTITGKSSYVAKSIKCRFT